MNRRTSTCIGGSGSDVSRNSAPRQRSCRTPKAYYNHHERDQRDAL